MDWQNLELEIKNLSKKVDYQPDIIVGITRGGLIPSRLLSTSLGVKNRD